MIRLIILLFLITILDIYTYQAFKAVGQKQKWIPWAYWGVHILLYAGLAVLLVKGRDAPREFFTYFFSVWVVFYLPKIFIAIPLSLEDLTRAGRWGRARFQASKQQTLAPVQEESKLADETKKGIANISRSKFISQLALGAASMPFIGTLYGITLGKYDFRTKRVKVPIKNLPASFEGLTITHISDIHTGSFDTKACVWKGFEMVNEQNSDLIFFTGDLVNNRIEEVKGYEDIFSELTAPLGVFSTLGNHDYGNYADWPNEKEKAEHFQRLVNKHGEFGWNLLKNENHQIVCGDDRLAIIGVENWGKSPRFPKKGDLKKASLGTEDAQVKLLLSHDPTHWDARVRKNFQSIDVTFSGHTHGFQFGIEIPGVKWSPAQYMYEQWAGLYQEGEQFLYVNRGFGYLGFAGRVGIWPEITVMELTRA